MDNKGYGNIPSTLSECITFIVQALPIRSVPTFIELLVGAMITQAGFVTEAWLAINPVRSWSAYYKWLQQGKWSWVAVGVQWPGWWSLSFHCLYGFSSLMIPLSTGAQREHQAVVSITSMGRKAIDPNMLLANAG